MDIVIENSIKMKKSKRTLLRKEGKSNVAYRGIEKKNVKYLKDLYVTLIDLKWRWALLILFLGFFLTQLIFSVVYFLLSYVNGDLDHIGEEGFQPCISNLHSYWDALLFSMETQSTVGYGTIYPNAECGGTVPVVYLQIIFGVVLETILLGFIFVKVARPKHRRHTLMFSHNACLCLEDQQMTLQVRVGDIRNSHLIDCHVYGALVKRKVCQEKKIYPLFQHELDFEAQGMRDKLYLIWPMVLSHKITENSPLYTLTPEDFQRDLFELIIILEGTIESTGEMVQARTSFTSQDIIWGHRFAQLEEYDERADKWCINFVRFHDMELSETPACSAREWAESFERQPETQKERDVTSGQLDSIVEEVVETGDAEDRDTTQQYITGPEHADNKSRQTSIDTISSNVILKQFTCFS